MEGFIRETNLNMGANQSTRKLTVVNDEATGVVKISDSVLERLKGEISGEKKDSPPPKPEPKPEPAAAAPSGPVEPAEDATPPPPPPPTAAPPPAAEPPQPQESINISLNNALNVS